MRVKVDYALPATQMALAIALLRWDRVLQLASARVCDMAGPSPAFTLLISVNAPVILPRTVWDHYLYMSYYWDNAALIAAVGLLWYWVALNIRSWRQRRTVLMFSWRPARFFVDAFLIVYGLLFGLGAMFKGYEVVRSAPYWVHAGGCFGPGLWFNLLPSITTAGLYLGWSLVLVFFFVRDFSHCALRKIAAP